MSNVEEDIFDQIFEKNTILCKIIHPELINQIFENPSKIPHDILISRINKLTKKLIENREFIEFFSEINGKSIYFILFEIIFNPSSNEELQNSIFKLIHELSFHIELNKEIFEYLFNKLSLIFRKIEKPNPKIIQHILQILNELFYTSDEISLNPKNYFYFTGDGNLTIKPKNTNNYKLIVNYGITIILNFKVGLKIKNEDFKEDYTAKLLKLTFDSKEEFSINLKYPFILTVDGINHNPYRLINHEEWNNMIINLGFDNKKKNCISIIVNGENSINTNSLNKMFYNNSSEITNMVFFDKFVGETTSIIFFSQVENGVCGIFDNYFLSSFKNNYEGIWKKKRINNFLKVINKQT